MDKDEWVGKELKRPKMDLRDIANDDILIDTIMRKHPYINSKYKAKEYLNNEYESPVPSRDMRSYIREELEEDEFERLKEIKEPTKW